MRPDSGACADLHLSQGLRTGKDGHSVAQAGITLQDAISELRTAKGDILEQGAAVFNPGTLANADRMRELQAAPELIIETDVTAEISAQLLFHVPREPAFPLECQYRPNK